MKKFIQKNKAQILLAVAIIIPFLISAIDLLRGNIPFWYDPARDFIFALDNLHKPTLIGPTTGIPGLFYGPYWIWLLSMGLLISNDPRIALFIILTIPYFVIFPYILFKFKNIYGLLPLTLVWILFAFGFGRFYATQAWNPHLAPLLFLALFAVLFFTDFTNRKKAIIHVLIAGFISGLLINFHWSLGATLFLGSLIFLLVYLFFIQKQKHTMFTSLLYIPMFGIGAAVSFLPFLLFELRHGFEQIKVIVTVITTEVPIVGVTGLTQVQIMQEFFNVATRLLQTPAIIGYGILVISVIAFLYCAFAKKISLNEHDRKLGVLIVSYMVSVLFVYLTAKNPVWSYHFLGTEIIFVFIVVLFTARFSLLRKLLAGWVVIVVVYNGFIFINSLSANPLQSSSLYTKEYITELIINDAKQMPYTVYTSNPAIYSYDYSYLFSTRGKDMPWDPGTKVTDTDVTYLIIPKVSEEVKHDFIQYRSPDTLYRTVNSWQIADGSTIIKRVKK